MEPVEYQEQSGRGPCGLSNSGEAARHRGPSPPERMARSFPTSAKTVKWINAKKQGRIPHLVREAEETVEGIQILSEFTQVSSQSAQHVIITGAFTELKEIFPKLPQDHLRLHTWKIEPEQEKSILFFLFYTLKLNRFLFLLPLQVIYLPKSLQASATSCMVISSLYTSYVRKLSWTPASSLQGFGGTYRVHGFALTMGKKRCEEPHLSFSQVSSPNVSTTIDFKQVLMNPYCREPTRSRQINVWVVVKKSPKVMNWTGGLERVPYLQGGNEIFPAGSCQVSITSFV